MGLSRRDFIQDFTQKLTWVGLAAQPWVGSVVAAQPSSGMSSWSADEKFWKKIRACFPITREKTYLNNGGLGPSPDCVIEAVCKGIHDVERVGELGESDQTRAKLAAFVGAAPEELSFTHNTTEGINIVVWGLQLKHGDEVILTTHEHAGNALPWLNRARLDGIVLKTFEPAGSSEKTFKRIQSLIGPRTRVIAVPHVTCTQGAVLPVNEISDLGRAHGIFVMIDGAHGTGMMPLDLHQVGCDFYASCGHKWLCGPKGTGYLYVRREMLPVLQARAIGAYSAASYDLLSVPPQMSELVPSAHRYDYGSQNEALLNGMGAAIDFMNQIGMEKVHARSWELTQWLREELSMRKTRIQLLSVNELHSGHDSYTACITAFRIKDVAYDRFGMHARTQGIRLRQVAESGLNLLRVSTHLYNNEEDLKKLLKLIDEYR